MENTKSIENPNENISNEVEIMNHEESNNIIKNEINEIDKDRNVYSKNNEEYNNKLDKEEDFNLNKHKDYSIEVEENIQTVEMIKNINILSS